MLNLPSPRRETNYGMPAADQILFNRFYVVGYSYYFRQAKWALEIVDTKSAHLGRANDFRPDFRIPEIYRADLADYAASGYDRGHLVSSADEQELALQNSETFLLSNMCPQAPKLNRDIWRKLETAVRELDERPDIYETFVISGPIFDFDKKTSVIGSSDPSGVTLPIPHAFFKSVLAEDKRGRLKMWSFILPNSGSKKPLETFRVKTTEVEKLTGILLWDRLLGSEITTEEKPDSENVALATMAPQGRR